MYVLYCTSEAAGMTGRHTMSSMPWRVGPPSAGLAAGGVGFPVLTKLDHIVVSFLDSSATRVNHINEVLKGLSYELDWAFDDING
jgi:hypothetical protein